MNTWISLLRGINVGGKNVLPMKELRSLLDELGYKNVQTYIQSGNCIFDSRKTNSQKISQDIAGGIANRFGFEPSVITVSTKQLANAIQHNPYDPQKNEAKTIHFFFLSEASDSTACEALQKIKRDSEACVLTKEIFYLLAPEGIARSALAARAEKIIGVSATARNYRTVQKIQELAVSR